MAPLPIINNQLPEKPTKSQGDYQVFKIWETIQGEGPFAGCPAMFIRLAGCNLQCPQCDTDYTSIRTDETSHTILNALRKQLGKTNLVVLTGGEPFRQPLKVLINSLLLAGYKVQIETNGTLPPGEDYPNYSRDRVIVVCSPKAGVIHPNLKPHISCLKYVVHADNIDFDWFPTKALGGMKPARPWLGFQGDIYIQPEDTNDPVQNEKNLLAARDCVTVLSKEYGSRVRLGVQLHKLLHVE